MEAVKNPWKELWNQLDKEEKKALIIETAKERYILTTLTTVFTLLMFSPYIMFFPFLLFFYNCAFFQFEKTLNKKMQLQNPGKIKQEEIDVWENYLSKLPRRKQKYWNDNGICSVMNTDPFYDTTAVNRVGTLAYSRNHSCHDYSRRYDDYRR